MHMTDISHAERRQKDRDTLDATKRQQFSVGVLSSVDSITDYNEFYSIFLRCTVPLASGVDTVL